MCKWGNTKVLKLEIPKENSSTRKKKFKNCAIDSCIYDLVKQLNKGGLKTIACCCGHGKQPPRISLRDGRELLIFDYDTATKIGKMFPPIN